MYQRAPASTGARPPFRNRRAFYYDYGEDFDQKTSDTVDEQYSSVEETSPETMFKVLESYQTVGASGGPVNHHAAVDQIDPMDENSGSSCESYIQGSHDDSIREIEKVIANAIAKIPTADSVNNTVSSESKARPQLADVTNKQEKPVHTSDSRNAALGFEQRGRDKETGISSQRLNKKNEKESGSGYKLDPAFADFSSLLSSFDRLAKSPFSKFSDDEDTDDEDIKRQSKQMTLELLDRVALESKAYKRRHRRNIAAMRISTMGFEADESTIDLQMSNNNSILASEPLGPLQETGSQSRLMKELPPLPRDWKKLESSEEKENHARVDGWSSKDAKDKDSLDEDALLAELPSLSSKTEKRDNWRAPLKFKLRMNTSTSSVDSELMPDALKLKRDHVRSLDEEKEGVVEQGIKQPPRLKLKISRTQLGQGRTSQQSGITRNNRLKQCNSLADVIPSAQQLTRQEKDKDKSGSASAQRRGLECSLDTINSEVSKGETSPQPSDQFNISYPPSLKKKASTNSRASSTLSGNETPSELRSAKSDVGPNGQRGLRQKLSFLRLRLTNNQKTASTKAREFDAVTNAIHENGTASLLEGMADVTKDSDAQTKHAPRSVKSERTGGRVKRWASDAKRALRLYVRRRLVRPRHGQSIE